MKGLVKMSTHRLLSHGTAVDPATSEAHANAKYGYSVAECCGAQYVVPAVLLTETYNAGVTVALSDKAFDTKDYEGFRVESVPVADGHIVLKLRK